MKRLPDTELEVMKALWDSGPDTPRAALERGRSNRYTPLVSREDYLSFDSRSVLSRLYGSSPRNFVAALARDGLAPGEVDELRALLDELERGAK